MDPFLEYKYPRFMTTEDIKNELWQLGLDTSDENRTTLENLLSNARKQPPKQRPHKKYNKKGLKIYL